jgi:type II secretory pathway component GspD/PulD (secretin)
MQKQTQVLAVADLRTSSVVVTASKDLMVEITGMMDQLDVASTRDQKVFVYHLNNADPQQALTVLQGMFGGSSSSTSRGGTTSSSTSALGTRQTQNATSTTTSGSSTGIGGSTGGAGGGNRGGAGF